MDTKTGPQLLVIPTFHLLGSLFAYTCSCYGGLVWNLSSVAIILLHSTIHRRR